MTTPYPSHAAASAVHVPVQAGPVVAGPAQYRPVAVPQAATYSAATRHLCAGAYLDADFRRTSLREVYYQAKRMVAPSYGFDLATVLLHCLRARNIAFFRDVALVAVMLVALVAAPLALLLALNILWLAHLILEAWRVLRDAVRRIRAGEFDGTGTLARLGMLGLRFLVGYAVFTFLGLVMAGSVVDSGAIPSATWAGLQLAGWSSCCWSSTASRSAPTCSSRPNSAPSRRTARSRPRRAASGSTRSPTSSGATRWSTAARGPSWAPAT